MMRHERAFDPLRAARPVDRPAFERVRETSERVVAVYGQLLSPWVQMAGANPIFTAALSWLHPMRISRAMFAASFQPVMHSVAAAAKAIHANRPVSDATPFRQAETAAFKAVHDALVDARELRDRAGARIRRDLPKRSHAD